MFEVRKAQRKAVPLVISLESVSGGGKTMSALRLARGLAGDPKKVCMIDTERGRGEMYTDSPTIKAAYPESFGYIPFAAPYSPERYVEAIRAAEETGATVCIVDQASYEWDGIGGCTEIAEKKKLGNNPNWAKAKLEHKRFLNYVLTGTNMTLVLCLRAQEKTKPMKVAADGSIVHDGAMVGDDRISTQSEAGEIKWVPLGIMPIAEKAFAFEMTVRLQLEEKTHFAKPIKVPEPLVALFPGGKMLTEKDGEAIRQWNLTGAAETAIERLHRRARAAAELGGESYHKFFSGLSAKAQKALADTIHEECKYAAEQVDATGQKPQTAAATGKE